MNSVKIFFVLICFALANCLTAQSTDLANKLQTCYQDLINQTQLNLSVKITAKEKHSTGKILESEEFVMIKEGDDSYVFFMNNEIIQSSEVMLQIDHEFEQVFLTGATNEHNSVLQKAIASLVSILQSPEANLEIKQTTNNKLLSYQIFRESTLLLEVDFKDDRISTIRQYPPEKVEHDNKKVTVCIEMKYNYTADNKIKRLEDVVQLTPKCTLKKYKNYRLTDYRKLNNK